MLTLHTSAGLTGSEFLKASRGDTVQLRVLPPMSHHFVGVRADEVALQTVEVRCLVLHRPQRRRVRALGPSAGHVRPVLLEIATHQGVQTLVPRCVLHETRLVAERVAAVLSHAVEVGLVLPVAAVRVPAVFVEPEPEIVKKMVTLGVLRMRNEIG